MEEENTTQQDETTESQVQNDNAELDDIDLSDIQAESDEADENQEEESEAEGTGDQGEADQHAADAREEDQPEDKSGDGTTEEKQEEQDQLFELKHLGEVRKVGKEEVTALAQKGMDWEHMKSERDANKVYHDFIQSLADRQKIAPEELMDNITANLMVEDEKAAGRSMDQATALERVKLEREKRAFEAERQKGAEQQKQESEADRKRREGFLQFAKDYPKLDVKTIPQEVWDKVRDGANLSDAYTRYENRKLREENEKLKQNQSNKEKSTGSRKTAGSASKDEAFDSLWYNGD